MISNGYDFFKANSHESEKKVLSLKPLFTDTFYTGLLKKLTDLFSEPDFETVTEEFTDAVNEYIEAHSEFHETWEALAAAAPKEYKAFIEACEKCDEAKETFEEKRQEFDPT